jgi:hypothetical protein
MRNKAVEHKEQKYSMYFGTKRDYKKETTIARRNKLNINAEQREEQKNRDHKTKYDFKGTKASAKEQIESE